jgi:hypothetical protein
MEEGGVGQAGRCLRSHEACSTMQPSNGRVIGSGVRGNMQALWGPLDEQH